MDREATGDLAQQGDNEERSWSVAMNRERRGEEIPAKGAGGPMNGAPHKQEQLGRVVPVLEAGP